jgi:hypothetical protein
MMLVDYKVERPSKGEIFSKAVLKFSKLLLAISPTHITGCTTTV